jgi:hypothetical protein
MVRPPKIRHSKARRDPVTIELDPADVTREATATVPKAKQAPEATAATPGPKPARQEPAATKKASDATPAAKDAPMKTAPVEATAAAANADAPKPTPAAPGAREPEAKSAAADAPVFGRDASASAPTSSRAAPPRPAAGPSAGSSGADRPAPKRGGLSMIAAGVIGGIVVLAGAGALQYAGVLPSPGSSVEPGEPAGLADLRAELAALRDQVAAGGNAAQQPDPAQAARLDELASALDQIRTDLTELRSAVSQGEGGDAAGLQALDQRMSELESAVAALGQNTGSGSGEPVDLAPLTDRIGAVENQLAEVSRAAQAASEATSGLPDRIATLDERLTTIDTRVGELAARIEDQAANPRIALAIAAAGLKAAIDRGDPFMTELETYASIAPNAPEIADLRGLAASGVPTRSAISQDVDAAANRMIAAAAPPGDDAGFFGRLLDSMQSVIKVRPIGDVEGDDVGAIVARLEAAILAGDYARAVGEYETLPESAKQAGAEFIARVKARQTADALVDRALSGALRPQEG